MLLREIQTRFGSQKLGYFWAVLDPMATIIIFALIKEIVNPHGMVGIDYPVFLASGYIGFFMFKNIVLRSFDVYDANKGLFIYKQVKPFDAIVTRVLLEFSLTIVIIILFLFIGWYLNFEIVPKNTLYVILGYMWLVLFSFSISILFSLLGFFYENFKKIMRLIFLPLYFLSAVLYTLDSIPSVARKVLLLNPLVHFMEMIHGNYFYGLDTKYVNYIYMLLWTLIPLFLGLWLYNKSEKKIIMS